MVNTSVVNASVADASVTDASVADASMADASQVNASADNARDLECELEWFIEVLNTRLKSYFDTGSTGASIGIEGSTGGSTVTSALKISPFEITPLNIPPPDLSRSNSCYARFIRHYDLSAAERLVVLLALIPHIRPQVLDVLWCKNEATGRGFTEFGGLNGTTHGGFIPTGETAIFILAGDDLAARFELMHLFDGDHLFSRHHILHLSPVAESEPMLSGALTIPAEYIQLVTTTTERKPNFNNGFPARLIETQLDWSDLVLPFSTLEQLDEIKHWILYGEQLLHDWEMHKKLRPGFTSLFYGPPGTGKTFSACLLGKHCGCDVYKIDLSMIVSKYIGETEKNLARVFDMAEHKRWILFFDEADALFGKRTKVDDSHDRYANQEISFLLQRIEEFDGVVILASNLKANIDDSFIRRFQSMIFFPMPKPAERLRIWKNAFSPKAVLEDRLDLGRIAEKHELSGGTIMNVIRYSSLKAVSRNETTILLEDVEEGIRRELLKEGRTV